MSYDPPGHMDPYSEAYTAPEEAPNVSAAQNDNSARRSRSPDRRSDRGGYRRRSPPAARRPTQATSAPTPTNVLGVFGLSIRSTEADLQTLFQSYGPIESVVIVYDQRQADRSRGFGFVTMERVEDATRAIESLNGVSLNGRNIRVDYSVTQRAHKPTPGEYMGHRRSAGYNHYGGVGGGRYDRDSHGYDSGRSSYRDRERERSPGYKRNRDRSRSPYGQSSRHGRDRRPSPSYRSGGGGGGGGRDWRDRDRDRSPVRKSSRRSYTKSRSPPRSKNGAGDHDASNGRSHDIAGENNGGGSDRW